jgi:cytochrome bd-type quinol oxidase subunit 2
MPDRDWTLRRSTLIVLFAGPPLLYLTTAAWLGSRSAIEIANAALLALAGGVATAYFPSFWAAMTTGPFVPGRHVLGAGIFVGFASILIARTYSILWRAMGQDPSWLDRWDWGLHISLATAAALGHLAAKEALKGSVPKREWVRIGIYVAAGLGLLGLASWVF